MRQRISLALTMLLTLSCSGINTIPAHSSEKKKPIPIPNRLINYSQFEKIVLQSGKLREKRRLSEAQFLKMMSEKNVVVLDARTDKRYEMLHIRGAVNLPFTEFTAQSLAKIIPSKKTKVLIYCNNNFLNNRAAFAEKTAAVSLNLSTFTSLRAYGYTNIYELGPLLDVRTTRLPFSGPHAEIQKLFTVSGDWRSRMADTHTRYKLARIIEGPDSFLTVVQETPDAAGLTLRNLVQSRVGGNSGLVLEDAGSPGRYTLAVSDRALRDYLRQTNQIADH